jgi:hypothetical protein
MKKLFLVMGSVLLLASCNQSPKTDTAAPGATETKEVKETSDAPKGEYGLKSAIVETETEMPGMGTTTMKITFDDYGKKKLTEMTMSMSMGGHSMNHSSKSLYKDDYIYSWSNMTKSGTKMKLDPSKLDPNKDLDFAKLTEEMKAKIHLKEEGTEMIGGKECKIFSYEAESMKGKMWLWQQIPLKSELIMGDKTVVTNFKSIQENPSIPSGTFDIPAGIDFKEMNISGMRPK